MWDGKFTYHYTYEGKMNSERGGHGCAHMIIGGRHYIYVTGGFQMTKEIEMTVLKTTEYFDLTDEKWYKGKLDIDLIFDVPNQLKNF